MNSRSGRNTVQLRITEIKPSVGPDAKDNSRGNLQVSRGDILPKPYFLNLLRMEKRRVDRSKAPLSIVLFLFHNGPSASTAIREFSASLQRNTRETDIKGWVEHNAIGIILLKPCGLCIVRFGLSSKNVRMRW